LYREYENVLFQYGVRLRPPVLRIDDATSVWGSWHPMTRVLSISKRLIESYSWDVVIEVLKHEMAHQLATEQLGGGHHHDATFLAACKRFGVADWAARATGALPTEIPSWKDKALSEEEERLLKRAEKLLALAGSANEHEALLAMQRVRELYAKHRLDRLHAQRAAEPVYLILGRKKKRIEAHESMILSILAEHFFVRVIYGKQFDAKACEKYQVAEVIGTRENVLMAEYVYHYLWQQVHALWDAHRSAHDEPASAKRSYMMGVLSGFRDKLGKKQPVQPEERALILVSERELDAYVSQRFPRLTSKSWGGGRLDRGAYEAGVSAGERLVLRKGVTERGGSRGLALPGKSQT